MFRRSHSLWFHLFKLSLCVLLGLALAIGPVDRSLSQSTLSQSTLNHSQLVASNNSSKLYLEEGRQAYADQRYRDAIATWSQSLDSATPQQHILTLSYLCAAHQALGQFSLAQNYIQQSLEQLAALPTASPTLSGQVYNTLGALQLAQGQAQLALDTWQTAATFYQQANDDSRYLNNLLNQVQAQQSLGYYHRVQTTLTTVEQRLPNQSTGLQIRGYLKLGHTQRLLGHLDTAKANLQQALTLAQQTLQPTDSISLELGNTAQAAGEIEGAIAQYQQAEQSNHPSLRTQAYLNRLSLLARTTPDAVRPLIPALSTHLEALPSGRSQVYAYLNAGQSLLQLGTTTDLETAAHLFAQAIHHSQQLQDRRAEAYATGYLGHAYERTQQWRQAQALTETALQLAQSINAADVTYQWQWQLGRLHKHQAQKESALETYRAALKTLRSLRQDLVATSDDLQFSFRDNVEPVYRELVDLLLQSDKRKTSSLDRQASPVDRLIEAREIIESLQVAELNNFFKTACLDAQRVPLEQVEQATAAVIYPIILPQRLEILVSLPGQPLQQYTTPISQTTLEQTLTAWRQNLEKPYTTPEGKTLGQQLYTWLIEPIHPALEETEIQNLVFVLDGALRNAPMAALYNGTHYLLENYAISLAPGLQLLNPRPLQDINQTVLLGGLSEPRHGFSALPNVPTEIEAVSGLLDSLILLNEKFTATALSQSLTDSERPIIHLATHGQFSSNIDGTFIVAWDRPVPITELGSLFRTSDENRLDPIELLVLSACETATGDNRAALGIAGASLQAGARSTLASLWSLEDTSGAQFVTAFYRALSQPEITKAEATRQAQLTLLKDANYRHPVYWSAYLLVGNWL